MLDHVDRSVVLQLFRDQRRNRELLVQPRRNRPQERRVGTGKHGDLGEQDALELDEGLLVEADAIEVVDQQPALAEAVLDGVARKALVVLLAREALFRSRRHHDTVADQARGRIVVEARDAEDVHDALRPTSTKYPPPAFWVTIQLSCTSRWASAAGAPARHLRVRKIRFGIEPRQLDLRKRRDVLEPVLAEPAEHLVHRVRGFVRVLVLIGIPGPALLLVGVELDQLLLDGAVLGPRVDAREQPHDVAAHAQHQPPVAVVEAHDDQAARLRDLHQVLEAAVGIARVVQDAVAEDVVERLRGQAPTRGCSRAGIPRGGAPGAASAPARGAGSAASSRRPAPGGP